MNRAACILTIGACLIAPVMNAHAARFTASDIEFRDATGEVKIVTAGGDAIEVSIRQGSVTHPVRVELVDGVVVVTGERWREDDAANCCDTRITRDVNLRKDRGAEKAKMSEDDLFSEYPVIEVTMPRSGDVSFTDARIKLTMDALDGALSLDACYVYGETGSLGEAVIGVVSGSRLVIGDVKSMLEVDISGDAEIAAGDAAMADIDIAGSGELTMGAVGGMLDISIAGSGGVRAARLDGPLTVRIAGSGSASVQAGRADPLRAVIDGSGGVFFAGTAVSPDLRLHGSAEVWMDAVNGRVSRSGGGDVYVGGNPLPPR